MNNETKEAKVTRDSKIYKAILSIKTEIKEWAKSQKEIRLAKQQKSPYDRARITGLHRVYLEIRGKDPEAHHLPENLYLREIALKYAHTALEKCKLTEEIN